MRRLSLVQNCVGSPDRLRAPPRSHPPLPRGQRPLGWGKPGLGAASGLIPGPGLIRGRANPRQSRGGLGLPGGCSTHRPQPAPAGPTRAAPSWMPRQTPHPTACRDTAGRGNFTLRPQGNKAAGGGLARAKPLQEHCHPTLPSHWAQTMGTICSQGTGPASRRC